MRVAGAAGYISQSTRVSNLNPVEAVDRAKKVESGIKSRTDSLSISAYGRSRISGQDTTLKGTLETLYKQKKTIADSKDQLVGATLEKGGTLDSIKSQLDTFDTQLKSVNDQITKAVSAEQEKVLSSIKNPQGQVSFNDQFGFGQSAGQGQSLSSMLTVGSDFSRMRTISSVRNRMQGDARVLASQIGRDEARALSGQKSTSKREQLDKLNLGVTRAGERMDSVLSGSLGVISSDPGIDKIINKVKEDLAAKEKPESKSAKGLDSRTIDFMRSQYMEQQMQGSSLKGFLA